MDYTVFLTVPWKYTTVKHLERKVLYDAKDIVLRKMRYVCLTNMCLWLSVYASVGEYIHNPLPDVTHAFCLARVRMREGVKVPVWMSWVIHRHALTAMYQMAKAITKQDSA